MKIENGLLHSPYSILLEERFPDHELLRLVGFGNYACVPLVDPGRREREVCCQDDWRSMIHTSTEKGEQ